MMNQRNDVTMIGRALEAGHTRRHPGKLSGIGLQFFAAPADRLSEIEARLAAIPAELEQEGADLDALEQEVKDLKEERKRLTDAAERRAAILKDIGSGASGRVTRTFQTGAPEQPTFSDVSPDAWYYTFVETVAEKGLFAGTGDGTFAPEASMTYAQFLTGLYQFSGEQLPVAEGPWYQSYVNWARNAGLIPAGMASFDPEAPITRQDMAALFGNFLGRYDHPGQPVTDEVPAFADAGDVADYAAHGVTLVYQMGLMSGGDGNRFAPLATATRAQVAVTMVQMARVMGK